ncbi:MAG: PAS domain S-box protein [Chloroflexi bacterium]|nr:PAS domain S-box protein [Chloroflexota bacterium]
MVVAFALYALAFFALNPLMGPAVVSLALLPVVIAGRLQGMRGGLLAGALCVPLNVLLLNIAGMPGWTVMTDPAGGASGTVLLFFAGGVVGRMSDLNQRAAQELAERKQAEEKLRESERRFREMLENVDLIAVMLDVEGRIVFCNDHLLRLTERKWADVLGQNWFALFVPPELHLEDRFRTSIKQDTIFPHFENDILTASGERRLVSWSNTILRDTEGHVIGTTSIGEDITERKRAAEALRESENRYHDLVENSQDLICTHDLDGKLLSVNEAAVRLTGYPREALLHMNLTDLLVPDVRHTFGAYLKKIRATGQASGIMQIQTAGGETRYWEYDNTLRTEGVAVPLVRGMAHDITERKQAEFARRESQTQLSEILSSAMDAIIVTDEDQRVVIFNPAAERIYKCPAGEAIGHSILRFMPENLRPDHLKFVRDFGESDITKRSMETSALALTCLRADGEAFPSEVSISQIELGRRKLYIAIVREVTEHKRAEEALRESEEKYRGLVTEISDGIFMTDDRGALTFANPALARMMGFEYPDQLMGRNFMEFVAPSMLNEVAGYFRQAMKTGQSPEVTTVEVVRVDGTNAVVEVKPLPIMEDGKVAGTRGVLRDITARKRAEATVLESERQMRALVTSLDDIVFEFDEEGTYLNVWTSNESLLARPKAEVFGRRIVEMLGEENGRPFAEAVKHVLASGQTENIEYPLEVIGGQRWFVARISPILTAEGHYRTVSMLVRDITERKRAEEELRLRLAELEALHTVSAALRAAQTRDEALPVLLDETLAVTETGAGVIWLYDSDSDELRAAVARGWFQQLNETPIKPGEGIAGAVFAGGQAHVSVEFQKDPAARATTREQIPLGWGGACVPIRSGAVTIGVLFVSAALPRQITTEQVRLLESLAEMAGAALHRMRLYEETVSQLDQLQALHGIDQAIAASMDLRMTLNVLLEHLTSQLKVDAASVLLFNPHLQALEYAAGRGLRTEALRNTRLRLGEGNAGRAALERKLVHIPDLRGRKTDFLCSPYFSAEGFVAYYGVPLIAKGQVKGVLEVFHRAPLDGDSAWLNFLETLAGQAAIAIDNAQLFDNLQRSNVELSLAYDATIEGWSHALDLRDRETEGHTLRVTEMTERLARAMGLGEVELVHVRRGALLHDIGKMGVPDSILLKPDKLTDDEWVLMRQHPQLAYDMLAPINYLRLALDIPYCHHEKWDGTGYPHGLKGEQIPLAARLFAVVDVYDALRSDRPYRPGWPEDTVREHIRSLAGAHFDPGVVEVFLQTIGEV